MATDIELRQWKPNGWNMFQSFGTYGSGLPLMAPAWTGYTHIFDVHIRRTTNEDKIPEAIHNYTGLRCKRNLFNKHPVDIFAVDMGNRPMTNHDIKIEHWERMMQASQPQFRPKVVIEAWPARAVIWESGPTGKASRIRWKELGYSTRLQRIDAQHIGGAIIQPRLMVVRIQPNVPWGWYPIDVQRPKRPMCNLLIPPGLIPRRRDTYYSSVEGHIHDPNQDPMPAVIGRWIKTEKGIRRLLAEEISRGLGVPKEWEASPELLTANTLNASTSIYHWEYISQCFIDTTITTDQVADTTTRLIPQTGSKPDLQPEQPILWRPPDLTKGGVWYQARVARLKATALRYPNYHQIVQEGLEDLDRHRSNYNKEGTTPTTLQLLWWEFPPEHQEEVRIGASMNFLKEPEPGLTPNSEMTDEQLIAAGEFVDELIELGVLQSPPEHRETLLNQINLAKIVKNYRIPLYYMESKI